MFSSILTSNILPESLPDPINLRMMISFYVYVDETRRVRDYGERECMPWASLGNVFSETLQQKSNILMNPINTFFNRTERLFSPLRQVEMY